MAPSFPIPIKFISLSLVVLAILISQANCQRPNQSSTLVFYLQEVASGPNATVVQVTGLRGRFRSSGTFGTISVVDDPVTLSPNRNSAQVGRIQGLLVVSALDGSNVLVQASIVFTNSQYNGSTLEIQGINRQHGDNRALSVVSGTGKFRFARGFAALETIYFDVVTSYSLIRLIITLQQIREI